VLSWRWVFFVNVPIGAVVLALAPRILPESRAEAGTRRDYDVAGALTITLGTMALVFTLIKANSWGWTSGQTVAGFVVSTALILAFVMIERRTADPLVPLRIFSNPSLAAADGTMLLVAAALFGVFFFLTLYLQQVLGYSALETGVAYLPLSLSLIGASALASRVVDSFGPKLVLCAGLLASTGGFALMTRVTGHGDYTSHVLPSMIVLGMGLGLSFVPITIAATTGVATKDAGLASGLLNTTQQVGGSLGLAILSTISTTRVTNALHAGAPLPVALTHGFKGGFVVGGVLCSIALVLALALLPGRPREREQAVEARALSFARCPGAPYCGHLVRVVALAGACVARSRARRKYQPRIDMRERALERCQTNQPKGDPP
jgi:predicted MFS family arabinose efflux permease